MSIAFYNCLTDGATQFESPEYSDAIPVIDAQSLYNECVAHGIGTDWWFPKANTICMKAGEDPSVAYLLLTHKYIYGIEANQNGGIAIPPINKEVYNHKVSLIDNNRSTSLPVCGWWFQSAIAIDGSSEKNDPDAVYLVKFVDRRYIWALQPSLSTVSGALLAVVKDGYNIVSPSRDSTDMEWDIDTVEEFPYDEATVGSAPYTWQYLLEGFWNSTDFLANSGSTLGFYTDDGLPPGGIYPEQKPLDIRPENTPTWKFFCRLLHSTGNEIYPKFDGTFVIRPIDDNFLGGTALTGELPNGDGTTFEDVLIEEGHIDPEMQRIPGHITMTFLVRSHGIDNGEITNRNQYYTLLRPFSSTGLVAYPSDSLHDPLLDLADYGETDGSTKYGVYPVGDGNVLDCIEEVTTIAMTAVYDGGSLKNSDTLDDFAADVLTKLLQSRLDTHVDATYGAFVEMEPCPQFEEVYFFINEGGPCTRFLSRPAVVGVEEAPNISGGSSFVDRLVAADETDDTPGTLDDKLENENPAGTYAGDPTSYQYVFYEVVTNGIDPDKNNKLLLYTQVGSGAVGPAGPAGPPGADGADGPTYTDGCGILIAGTVISFFPDEVAGPGLQVDPFATTTCSLAVDPADLAGCGLEEAADNVANSAVKLKINPSALAGCGLAVASNNTSNAIGPCKLKVDPAALAGCGLKAASDNQTDGDGPCKLVIDITAIANSAEGIGAATGNQDDGNGPCKLKVATNVTIKVPTSIELNQVGSTLEVKLNYTEYAIYGVAGATGSLSDTVTTTECP
jgi:hypothetical protein